MRTALRWLGDRASPADVCWLGLLLVVLGRSLL